MGRNPIDDSGVYSIYNKEHTKIMEVSFSIIGCSKIMGKSTRCIRNWIDEGRILVKLDTDSQNDKTSILKQINSIFKSWDFDDLKKLLDKIQ